MKFYGITDKLKELKRIQNLSFIDHSRLTVLTGRKRIGKTSPIVKACENTPIVYLFVSRDKEAVLVRRYSRTIFPPKDGGKYHGSFI